MNFTPAQIVILVWFLVLFGFSLRIGGFGRKEHARNPHGNRVVTFWNILDESKWTEEGLAHHRRVLRFLGWAALSFIPLSIIVSALQP